MSILEITHNAGFFSCCTARLFQIIEYFNLNKSIPQIVDCKKQFKNYKTGLYIDTDITYEYFKHPDEVCLPNISWNGPVELSNIVLQDKHKLQITNYKDILLANISYFIEKYFTLSDNVRDLVDYILKKYSISCHETCGVYYRGTDIFEETNTGPWDEYILRAKEIKEKNENIRFMVQSDEPGFVDRFILTFPDSIFVREVSNEDKFIHSLYFLATMYIISKTKYIICSSSNVSLWFIFFRNNTENIIQYLNQKEYMYTMKNELYQHNQSETDHWLY